MARRKGREIALQILYQFDSMNNFSVASLPGFWQQWGDVVSPLHLQPHPFTEFLIQGICEHLQEIDECLAQASQHWSLYRMSKIDRNVLRIAVFELLYAPETSPPIIINEAIEIGKQFGTEESAAFINGILDAIAKNLSSAYNRQEPQTES